MLLPLLSIKRYFLFLKRVIGGGRGRVSGNTLAVMVFHGRGALMEYVVWVGPGHKLDGVTRVGASNRYDAAINI